VNRLADRRLDLPAGVEAELELVERVAGAANAAAEVEAGVAELLGPARGLEEEQGACAELAAGIARSAEVVVQP